MTTPPSSSSSSPQGLVDISKDRYDLTKFWGRLQHFASVTSPLTLLSSRSELESAKRLVEIQSSRLDSSEGDGPLLVKEEDAKRYWKAKSLVESSLHPETGEVIPLPFRMSAFVPTNLIVVAGMLTPNAGMTSIVFWQWVNQSLNVAVNYSNANKSVPMDFKEVTTAYVAATTSAVGIAVGLTKVVPRLRMAAGVKVALTRLVPFVSVASAGVVNISCMRWKEISQGVDVFRRDEKGERVKVGESKRAGSRAVAMTAASRILTNIPTLILPPLALTLLQRKRLVPSGGVLARLTNLGLIGTSLLVFLPPAIATFPQVATIQPEKLESNFHGLVDERGEKVKIVEFNKGL
ncbi:Tricarboxylate/iron carrier [Violaceomyces palustris]|uniref:Tricarboxylate/iron carrier n=1 Tax=Violaceomyces palustris TaxID=1673888 RepID=A0ACD0NRG1_9BASI|nr:Tricarboxylate/iron carrier [Violaceomyces palustris]